MSLSRYAALFVLFILPAFADGQGKANSKDKKDEQRENERVKQAQQALNQAQDKHKQAAREVTEASQRLTKAEAEKRQAIDKAQQLRKELEDQQEVRLGMPDLLKQQATAKKAFDAAARPVLEALQTTAPYSAALADAKAAHEELQAARRANPPAPGSDAGRSTLVRRTLKPAELEKAALQANAAAQAARQQLSQVQEQVQAARAQAKAAVENDSSLRKSLQELDQRNTAADKAKVELARDREKLAAAAAKVNQEREQLARAQAADRKDDNKPKKNDNKPNNNKK